MRSSIIILYKEGAEPEVRYFERASEGKAAFRALPESPVKAELWDSGSGKIRTKKPVKQKPDVENRPFQPQKAAKKKAAKKAVQNKQR